MSPVQCEPGFLYIGCILRSVTDVDAFQSGRFAILAPGNNNRIASHRRLYGRKGQYN